MRVLLRLRPCRHMRTQSKAMQLSRTQSLSRQVTAVHNLCGCELCVRLCRSMLYCGELLCRSLRLSDLLLLWVVDQCFVPCYHSVRKSKDRFSTNKIVENGSPIAGQSGTSTGPHHHLFVILAAVCPPRPRENTAEMQRAYYNQLSSAYCLLLLCACIIP